MRRVVAGLVVAAAVVTGCASTETSVEGDVIYANNCARCHGSDLGGRVGPSLAAGSEAAAKDDAAYRQAILNGPRAMPAFTRFSDEQISAVISYIRSQQ